MKLFQRLKRLTKYRARELFEEVQSQVYPNVRDLERLKNYHKVPIGTLEEQQALNLKYRAMTHVPTTIEKTMTPAQLYDADCPLWCAEYSIEQLSYYCMLDSWPYDGQGIIEFMENSVVPMISAQNVFEACGIIGNICSNSGYPSKIMSHHMIIPEKPRQKGTIQIPPSGPVI